MTDRLASVSASLVAALLFTGMLVAASSSVVPIA